MKTTCYPHERARCGTCADANSRAVRNSIRGPKEIRTPDLLNANQSLYQLSYGPDGASMKYEPGKYEERKNEASLPFILPTSYFILVRCGPKWS